jgi:hypothetical protein
MATWFLGRTIVVDFLLTAESIRQPGRAPGLSAFSLGC